MEKMTTKEANKILGKYGIKMSVRNLGYKVPDWGDGDVNKRKAYRISLKKNNKSASAVFYDSLYNTGINRKLDVADALYCILEDFSLASCINSFDDYIEEFGYGSEPLSTYPKHLKCFSELKRQEKAFAPIINKYYRDILDDLGC